MERSIQWCHENGFDEFDFMTGSEAYKAAWADEEQMVEDYAIPFALQGRAILAWYVHGWDRVRDRPW